MITSGSQLSPCLWFDGNLEEAITFYTTLFPDSSVGSLSYYGDQGLGEQGSVMAGDWTMFGLSFRGINGGPQFSFTEAISFSVTCADQVESDRYWDALTADGGTESQCGWLKDKFGVSWQIIPKQLYEFLSDANPARAKAATDAMLTMRRIVVDDLAAAADQAG